MKNEMCAFVLCMATNNVDLTGGITPWRALGLFAGSVVNTLATGYGIKWGVEKIEQWVVVLADAVQRSVANASAQSLELAKASVGLGLDVVKETGNYALYQTHGPRKQLQATARPLRRLALHAYKVSQHTGASFPHDALQRSALPLRRIALGVDDTLHTDVKELYRAASENMEAFFEAIRSFWSVTLTAPTTPTAPTADSWWQTAWDATTPNLSRAGQVMGGYITNVSKKLEVVNGKSHERLVMMCTLLMLAIGAFSTHTMAGAPLKLSKLSLQMAGMGKPSKDKQQALLQVLFAAEMFAHVLRKHELAPVAWVMQNLLGTCGELLPSAVQLSTGVVKDCSAIIITFVVIMYCLKTSWDTVSQTSSTIKENVTSAVQSIWKLIRPNQAAAPVLAA